MVLHVVVILGCKLTFFTIQSLDFVNMFFLHMLVKVGLTWVSVSTYGLKCLGKIMAYLMSFFLNLCDWSVPYCASLEAWNWVVARQHLDASHPRSSVWPNQNVTIFSGNYFWKTLNCHNSSTVRAFDLIPKLRARPEYQLSSGTKYTAWLASAFPPDRNHP